jgi:hypothetical protein
MPTITLNEAPSAKIARKSLRCLARGWKFAERRRVARRGGSSIAIAMCRVQFPEASSALEEMSGEAYIASLFVHRAARRLWRLFQDRPINKPIGSESIVKRERIE